MYSERAQERIDSITKWANKIASGIYNVASIHDKLLTVDLFDTTPSMNINSIDIYYNLTENEDLLFTANQLLENIDEALNFTFIDVAKDDYLAEMSLFKFVCDTDCNVTVNININFSASKNCNLEYEDVTTKKAVLKCA